MPAGALPTSAESTTASVWGSMRMILPSSGAVTQTAPAPSAMLPGAFGSSIERRMMSPSPGSSPLLNHEQQHVRVHPCSASEDPTESSAEPSDVSLAVR
jgi:hypothetical protein